VLLYIGMGDQLEGNNPLPGVELRMNQNDKILRYLTVRTDRPVESEESSEDSPEGDKDDKAGEEE